MKNNNLNRLSPAQKNLVLFTLILLIGIFARAWQFGAMPPGVNVDEASIGIEAYDLYKFSMDRNGVTYPIHLVSWGSGQNALYAYMILPLVALNGLNAVSIRLPMMLAGILSLLLMYLAGKKLLDKKFGLLAMFFMAISPWHIVNSRWAVESNIMPFLFLAGFTALLYATQKNHWFIVANIFFASCLYAYGTAYVGIPVFFLIALPILLYTKRITLKRMLSSLGVFAVLALPIILFVIINTFQLNSIHIGAVTIPRMPVQARYEAMAAVFGDTPFKAITENIGIMLKLLWTQEDAYPWNFVAPFGYFYKVTSAFALLGLLIIFFSPSNPQAKSERGFLLAWIFASIAIGIIHPTNLTRLNLIFTPILLCLAFFVYEMDKRFKYSLPIVIAALFVGFIFFNLAYHGEEYQKRAGSAFNAGIIPAIEYASEKSNADICFTESTYSLYIYVLFTQKMNPTEYINDLTWVSPTDPADPARTPRDIGRYHFTLDACKDSPDAAYILLPRETPPNTSIAYKSRQFDKFQVYLPKK